MAASYTSYGDSVRVRNEGSPMTSAYDVFVEKLTAGNWEVVRSFNSMSDDYAYTNAREVARAIAGRVQNAS